MTVYNYDGVEFPTVSFSLRLPFTEKKIIIYKFLFLQNSYLLIAFQTSEIIANAAHSRIIFAILCKST